MREPGHRGDEVRRVPAHRLVVDARRVDPLGRRLGQPGAAAARRPARPPRGDARSTRSATAASATSTRSSSSIVLFSVGGLFALYEGWHKLQHPEPIDSWQWVPVAGAGRRDRAGELLVPHRDRRVQPRARRRSRGCSSSAGPRRPSCRSCCSRTSRALVGLVLALFGVGLTLITDDGMWDGIGTIAIGVLLVVGRVRARHRDQEPAARRGRQPRRPWPRIEAALLADDSVRAGHPHEDAAPRAGRAAGRGQDRGRARRQRGRGGPGDRRRRGADPRRRSRSPGSSTSSPTSTPPTPRTAAGASDARPSAGRSRPLESVPKSRRH